MSRLFPSCGTPGNASGPETRNAYSRFVSGNACRQEAATRCAYNLCHRQSGRENDGCGMKDRTVAGVVLFREMRASSIDHAGEIWAGPAAIGQYFAGAVVRPHRRREVLENTYCAVSLAGERRSCPVDKQIDGTFDYFDRYVRSCRRAEKSASAAVEAGCVVSSTRSSMITFSGGRRRIPCARRRSLISTGFRGAWYPSGGEAFAVPWGNISITFGYCPGVFKCNCRGGHDGACNLLRFNEEDVIN